MNRLHDVISVYILSFPGPNAGTYRPEKLRIRTLYTHRLLQQFFLLILNEYITLWLN